MKLLLKIKNANVVSGDNMLPTDAVIRNQIQACRSSEARPGRSESIVKTIVTRHRCFSLLELDYECVVG
jgi:hypothetical protein